MIRTFSLGGFQSNGEEACAFEDGGSMFTRGCMVSSAKEELSDSASNYNCTDRIEHDEKVEHYRDVPDVIEIEA